MVTYSIDELLRRGKEDSRAAAAAPAPVQAATPPAPQFSLKDLTQAAWWATAGMNGFGDKGAKARADAQANYLSAITGAAGAINQQTGVGAAAALDTTKARLLPAESASQIALQGSQGSLLRQQANLTGVQARLAPGESAARNAGIYADAGVARANTALIGANTDGVRRSNTLFGAPDQSVLDEVRARRMAGQYSGYTTSSIVPGR